MSTDEFESSLRARLKTIEIPHDDTRAGEMISVATVGRPLADRRNVLAPLATAAAVVAVGATVAVVASGGSGSDPAPSGGGPVGAPSGSGTTQTSGQAVLTYVITTSPSGETFTDGTVDLLHTATGKIVRMAGPVKDAAVRTLTIENARGDDATVRIKAGGHTVLTENMTGRARTSTTLELPRGTSLEPTVQCRKPGKGDRCRLVVRAVATVNLQPLEDKSTGPALPTGPSSNPPATPRSSTSVRVYEPPAPPSTDSRCPGCQIP